MAINYNAAWFPKLMFSYYNSMRGVTAFGGLAIDERGFFFDRMGDEVRL
jgi:hypothetical protein